MVIKALSEVPPAPEPYPLEIFPSPYNVREYPLDEERTDFEIPIPGDTVTVSTDGTLSGITIKFDSPSNDAIPCDRMNPVDYPDGFDNLYLSHAPQTGKKLVIFIGRAAGARAVTERTVAAPRFIFYTLRSDKDLNFTGALTQYAKEDENLAGLLENKIRILDIAIQSDQALDYFLMFWRKDTFDNSDLDVDTCIGMVQLDLHTYGKQVDGAGQYYMSREDVNLDYEDEDGTHELHVSLYNNDATPKVAGTSGEITIFIKYDLRG